MTKRDNKNAVTHGAFSEAVLLSGESKEDFEELHNLVKAEWNPEGPTEEDRVFNLAYNLWRKRRVRRYMKSKIDGFKREEDSIERQEKANYMRLLDLLELIDTGQAATITEENLPDKIGEGYANQIKKKVPRKNFANDSEWIKAVDNIIASSIENNSFNKGEVQNIHDILSNGLLVNRELNLEERIDAKIDKDIMALGKIKTMKEIGIGSHRASVASEPVKKISSPSIAIADDK